MLHRDPPLSPKTLLGRPALFALVLAAAVVLGVLAAVDGGSALLTVDEPITEWIADHRREPLTTLLQWGGHLGDNIVVFPLAAVTALLVAPRCRPLAVAVIGAALVRPAGEFVLKALIDRERPDIAALGSFAGPSHPSGHPLAAASFFGLVPVVLAAFHVPRRVWWASVGAVAVVVPMVALSRVYKGAHWTTDVVASLLWAGLYLLAVQGVFDRFHVQCGHEPSVVCVGDDAVDGAGDEVGASAPSSTPISPSREIAGANRSTINASGKR